MVTVRKSNTRRYTGWLALVAMLAQVFFSTVHMAAVAATLSGPLTIKETPAGSLGLLEICTANGLIQIAVDDGGPVADANNDSDNPKTTNLQCAVCGSAATALFATPGEQLPLALACEKASIAPQQISILDNRQSRRLDVIRSPPSYLHS